MPQTEKFPTLPPSPPNGPDRNGHGPEPVKNTPAAQIKASDRLFAWSFLPALVIIALLCIWLGFSDIYGTQRTKEEQKRVKIQVYRPPIKHPKPKPKPKPKIIPPKPKIIPKIVHIIPKPQPIPRPQPRPRPVVTRAPTVGHTVKSNTPTAVAVGPVSQAPVEAVPQNPGTNTAPTAPVVAPPPPPPPKPTPPAPVIVKPPPPPPPPPKPKPPAIPDQNLPMVQGEFHDINLPGDLDVTTLNSTKIHATWYVDEHGRASDIKFRPTGNSDVDQAIRDAINESHFTPAIHNGKAVREQMEHIFEID